MRSVPRLTNGEVPPFASIGAKEMKKTLKVAVVVVSLMAIGAVVIYRFLPVQRVDVSSELIMLGDLKGDRAWDDQDEVRLAVALERPFAITAADLQKIDVNRDDAIDSEDLSILNLLYRFGDPYVALEHARQAGTPYPRPRELFKYRPRTEYVSRPVFSLPHPVTERSPLDFLRNFAISDEAMPYERRLLQEIYDEALRFSFAWEYREPDLTEIEREYAASKLAICDDLFEEGRYYDLLLHLVGLVEDAETLSVAGQSEFIRKILFFREHLQDTIVSEAFHAFEEGTGTHEPVFEEVEHFLQDDLGIDIKLAELDSPRGFLDLQNYLDRAQWQKNKSLTSEDQFKSLILFAQYDRRYLRSVSRTSPQMTDVQLRNHNLPMILLFREALRIKGGDKLAAVGLLDEAVRIPLGWVKGIPPEVLPSSLALDNFLLPGNMEDGSDKSRHWNVFGGIALYKSPEDSLILSLKREIMDVRDDDHSVEAVREFIRDTIANINGIYYVVSMNPDLL
jgi:hypothetical protein